MVKRFIFVPVVNNLHLLKKAVFGIKKDIYDEYIIFNNTEAPIPEDIYKETPFRVWSPSRRMSFTETQNIMLKYAIENNFDYYSFMHNDCEVTDDSDVRLVRLADSLILKEDKSWGLIFTHYDVFCAFNTSSFKSVGGWGDKLWPKQESGYFLDNDYYRRLKLCGFSLLQLENCEGVLHNDPSNTIKVGKENDMWVSQQKFVLAHYKKKWGGNPPNEIFTVPFNNPKIHIQTLNHY